MSENSVSAEQLLEQAWPLLQRAWMEIVELTDGGFPSGSKGGDLLNEINRCEDAIRNHLAEHHRSE